MKRIIELSCACHWTMLRLVVNPGVAVVLFSSRWNERCRQVAPVVEQLCKKNPTVNFLKVQSLSTSFLCPNKCMNWTVRLIRTWYIVNFRLNDTRGWNFFFHSVLPTGGYWGKCILGKGWVRWLCSHFQDLQKWFQGEGVARAQSRSSRTCCQPF